jgi:TonB family protein
MSWNEPPHPPVLPRKLSRKGNKTTVKQLPLRLLASAAIVATPLAASAQSTAFVAPKLTAPGSSTTTPAGKGSVIVQVFVKKDGSFRVVKVLKSTNPADNASALEMAKTAKYKAATRGGHAVDAYYDYAYMFAGDGAASTGTGPMATALAAIRAGKYDDAKSQLNSYLQAHPGDAQANTLLGVASYFSNDMATAAMSFDKAGTVPDQYKTLAIQSYSKYASTLLDDKKFPDAITYAGKAIAADPNNLEGYYVRGIAESNAQNDAAAIADLQKARAIAVSARSDDKTLATIGFNLAVTQLDAGQFGEASTTIKDVERLDPSRRDALDKFAFASINNAAVALANEGKIADAVSRLESGATAFPSSAGPLTAQASYIMATDKKPDWKKVGDEADKALAIDDTSGLGNYVRGVAYAQQNDSKDALVSITKAKASPQYGTDASLAKKIDDALKQLKTAAQ